MLRKTDINGKLVQFAWWALAIIVFTLVVAIRIRLLGIPLERDEGEYAYAGQLILQGIPPYKLAYNMKFPGTYAAYALIMSIFGQTIHADSSRFASDQCCHDRADFLARAATDQHDGGSCCGSELCGSVCEPVRPRLGCTRDTFCDAARSRRNTAPAERTTSDGFEPSQPKQLGRLFASGLLFGIGAADEAAGRSYSFRSERSIIVWNDLHHRLCAEQNASANSDLRGGVQLFPSELLASLLWRSGRFRSVLVLDSRLRTGNMAAWCRSVRLTNFF